MTPDDLVPVYTGVAFVVGMLVGRVLRPRRSIAPRRPYSPTASELLATFSYWCRAEKMLNPLATDFSVESRAWERLASWLRNGVAHGGGTTWE